MIVVQGFSTVPKERFVGELPSDTRLAFVPFYSWEESGKGGTDSLPLPAKRVGPWRSNGTTLAVSAARTRAHETKGTRYAI